MPDVTGSLPSLLGGVSTQPNVRRSPDVVTELLNGLTSRTHGTVKRPPFRVEGPIGSESENFLGRLDNPGDYPSLRFQAAGGWTPSGGSDIELTQGDTVPGVLESERKATRIRMGPSSTLARLARTINTVPPQRRKIARVFVYNSGRVPVSVRFRQLPTSQGPVPAKQTVQPGETRLVNLGLLESISNDVQLSFGVERRADDDKPAEIVAWYPQVRRADAFSPRLDEHAGTFQFIHRVPDGYIYRFFINRGYVSVMDMDGNIAPVSITGRARDYLNFGPGQGDNRTAFRAVSVEKDVYINNRAVLVEADEQDLSPGPSNQEAIIYVNHAYRSPIVEQDPDDDDPPSGEPLELKFTVDGSDGGAPMDIEMSFQATFAEVAATQIAQTIAAFVNAEDGWTAELSGRKVLITRQGGDPNVPMPLEWLAEPDEDILDVLLSMGEVEAVTELPQRAWPDFPVHVVPDPISDAGNYWVEWDGPAPSQDSEPTGIWKEVIAPNTPFDLVDDTMPIAAIPVSVTSTDDPLPHPWDWNIDPVAWDEREAGDLESNPWPSFVGQRIQDMAFHQKRLTLCGEKSIVFSEVNEPRNFFRTTVAQLLDSDPIDIESAHRTNPRFHELLQWNDLLYGLSKAGPFRIHEDPVLSPTTVRMQRLSAIPFDQEILSRPIGERLFLLRAGEVRGRKKTRTSQVVEFRDPAGQGGQGEATLDDVSAHAAGYLLGDPVDMSGDNTLQILAVKTTRPDNAVYVLIYDYDFRDDPVQRSWMRWEIPPFEEVVAVDVQDKSLFLTVVRANGTYLYVLDLDTVLSD